MLQHNMESSGRHWQEIMRLPWITRVAEGQSPSSSWAESDTECSSTESEKVSNFKPCDCGLCSHIICRFLSKSIICGLVNHFTCHIKMIFWYLCDSCVFVVTLLPYPQSCINNVVPSETRVMTSPSMVLQRITEIDQKKEELKIEVSKFEKWKWKRNTFLIWPLYSMNNQSPNL